MSLDYILERVSTRKYKNISVENEKIDTIKREIMDLKRLYEEIDIDIVIIEDGLKGQDVLKGILGNVGKIKAPHYMIATSRKGYGYEENIGFVLEQMVLKLTYYGIGTCWLGAEISKEKLKRIVEIKENHEIVIMVAFGYPQDLSKSKKTNKKRRGILELFEGNMDNDWYKIMKCVRVAPSSFNSQPWKFIKSDEGIDVFMKSKKSILDLFSRNINLNKIDIGIALAHVYLTCKFLNLDIKFEKKTDRIKDNYEYITTIV